MKRIIAGKTILLNTVSNTTFLASVLDECVQTGTRENDKHIEWTGELDIAIHLKEDDRIPFKSNTAAKAIAELDILSASNKDPDNRPIIEPFRNEILALVEKFGLSGQSGGSAPYTAGAISEAVKKLCLHIPICPIMGIDEEWHECSKETGDNKPVYQNKRCSAIFKEEDRVHYLDAITWATQSGACWSGSALLATGDKIYSRQYIKSFPFTPKTFVIDVIEKEVAPDDWEFYVKDEARLNEVFEYYSKPTNP